ncbi:hypothetical protein LZC95_02790 [Pendulispora brunnea]|uniref:DUF3617 family protein n=1 Tax=Pendulispora brunnea TaxID=2905690 RepID=A0ABZ2KNY3_9BACT
MHKTLAVVLAIAGFAGTAYADDDVDADAYLGHWTFQSGSKITSPCSPDVVDTTGKAFDLAAGAAAHELTTTVQGCAITLVETDATHAKLKASTECTLPNGTKITFTSAAFNLTGSTLGVELVGRSGLCTITQKGTAHK